jgi:hypothetical protein
MRTPKTEDIQYIANHSTVYERELILSCAKSPFIMTVVNCELEVHHLHTSQKENRTSDLSLYYYIKFNISWHTLYTVWYSVRIVPRSGLYVNRYNSVCDGTSTYDAVIVSKKKPHLRVVFVVLAARSVWPERLESNRQRLISHLVRCKSERAGKMSSVVLQA